MNAFLTSSFVRISDMHLLLLACFEGFEAAKASTMIISTYLKLELLVAAQSAFSDVLARLELLYFRGSTKYATHYTFGAQRVPCFNISCTTVPVEAGFRKSFL